MIIISSFKTLSSLLGLGCPMVTWLCCCHPQVDSDPEQDTYTCSVSHCNPTAPMSIPSHYTPLPSEAYQIRDPITRLLLNLCRYVCMQICRDGRVLSQPRNLADNGSYVCKRIYPLLDKILNNFDKLSRWACKVGSLLEPNFTPLLQ